MTSRRPRTPSSPWCAASARPSGPAPSPAPCGGARPRRSAGPQPYNKVFAATASTGAPNAGAAGRAAAAAQEAGRDQRLVLKRGVPGLSGRAYRIREFSMRADVEAAKADIEQSIELLRRRL